MRAQAKKKTSLVSVTIPTYNSAQTLGKTLDAVSEQTYPYVEVIVVDSHSSDATKQIAENYGVTFIQTEGKLLKAREVGATASAGEFVLLLDSDQILERTSLERAVHIAQEDSFDMLFLEEHSYHPSTWLQRLFETDRRAIHQNALLDAETAVMLPRFFRRDVLLKALSSIPMDDLADVVAQDHAIIHWEVSKVAHGSAVIPNAVYHLDPDDVLHVIRHFYHKGKAAKSLDKNAVYRTRYGNMFAAKSRSRIVGIGNQPFDFASNLVLCIKGAPYLLGKWLG